MYAYVPAATDQYLPDAKAANFAVVSISHVVDGRNYSLGTNLNTQYTGAIGCPTLVTCYFSNSTSSAEVSPGREPGPHDSTGHHEWPDYVLDQSIVQTVSLGYGVPETNFPLEYATAMCNLFTALDARGPSALTESGGIVIGAGTARTTLEKV